jgi:hypothetical protein
VHNLAPTNVWRFYDNCYYANQADRPALVLAKVRVRKPKKFADSIDFESFLEENDIPSNDFQSKMVTKLLISQGFDAVEIGRNRILVAIFVDIASL